MGNLLRQRKEGEGGTDVLNEVHPLHKFMCIHVHLRDWEISDTVHERLVGEGGLPPESPSEQLLSPS